jgi:hypothetical protein
LIRGGSDALDMPSFMRRSPRFPVAHLETKSQTNTPVRPEPTKFSRQ